ncbi:NAD(P)-dependent alcohol dehydrogenase [Herpetosiphon llansteffanensis]
MPTAVLGYAAQSATSAVAPFEFARRDLRPDDVSIEILYCGVCHSDLHQARNEWHSSSYPLVPGHEIIGRVSAIGAEVGNFQPGDLVGVGCMVDSCQTCEACQAGLEQYCEAGCTFTYNGKDRLDQSPTFGGYSQQIVVSDKFVVRIPAGLDLQSAAPLLCAGITMYSPLRHWNVKEGDKVAIVGLGGLGHMGIKFAKAMGAEVTLFTRSTSKIDEAKAMGADAVVLSTDAEQMRSVRNYFDLIVDTVPNKHDFNPYIATLKRDRNYVVVGQPEPIEPGINGWDLMMGRKSISGSAIGGIAETQAMLDFSAEHQISCDVEVIDIQAINEAYERMLKSDVKYRFVIDMASLKS